MGILIVLIPLLIYLYAALRLKKSEINHPDDYFAAFRKVGRSEFTSSSIAYGFQVSTIYPYLFWGASLFLFVPFINALFWCFGILLFYLNFDKIQKYLGSGKTLPGLIGDAYGERARQISSILTVIGFIGYIIAELWFGSRVLLAIFPSNIWVYSSIFIFIVFIGVYLFRSGQISSIITDQLQLSFTYFGIFGIIIYLLYISFTNSSELDGFLFWGLVIITILIPGILYLRKFKFVSFDSKADKAINVLIVLSFILIGGFAIINLFSGGYDFSISDFINLEGFGYAGLISMMLLPLLWQFVDLTNWQRLLSVKHSENKEGVNQDIKKGLLNFSIESPFTWVLFIIFGVLISTSLPEWTFTDILIDFPAQLIASELLIENIFGYIFILSIISIMLSTVDSFIMGISFTYVYDLNRESKNLIESDNSIISNSNEIIKKGKVFSFSSVIIAVFLFIFFDNYVMGGGDLFINLLLTFYTASLSFFPLVFGFIFLRNKPNSVWANASMIIGALCGICLGVISVLYMPSIAWYPILTTVIISSSIYLIGYIKN